MLVVPHDSHVLSWREPHPLKERALIADHWYDASEFFAFLLVHQRLYMLSDDHPLIRACNNRYGIDLEQLSDGTFALRSANMTSMPEYFDTKTRRGDRPPNYFMDKERTRLCIAHRIRPW